MSAFQLVLFGDEASAGELPLGGVDDMNFVEILHNLPGSRRPPQGETISVPWERGERSYFVEYSSNRLFIEWKARGKARLDSEDFYIKVETPESKGLPTNLAGDVLVALMKMTADSGFKEAQIRTSRYELIKIMRWHLNGDYYRRLEDILSQFMHMTVATNALWDPERQRYYRGEFNILDSWEIEESASDDDPNSPLIIRWGKKTLDIFNQGYMKHLNTEVYYGLSNPTTKRIYRWLDKHLSLYPVVEIDVLRFAHKILGYGVSYRYPSKVISKLSSKFDTLTDLGFCLWEVGESQSDSGKKFIFTRLTDYSPVTLPRREYIVRALADRGVDHPGQLVDDYPWECCLRQLAYYEWRVRHGKPIKDPGAWLSAAIRNNHELPKALAMQMERAKEKTALWCDHMYGALTDEDRDEIDASVEEMLTAEGTERDEARRKQLRNHLLLSQEQQL